MGNPIDFIIWDGVLTKYVGSGGSVVIPDRVTKIDERAFAGCNLTEVILPSSVTEIGEKAFASCRALEKVSLPESVRIIGKDAFWKCDKLTTAGAVGAGGQGGFSYEFAWTDEIPENAFRGMYALKKVVLPDTIKVIGKNAFKGCYALEELNLSEDVKVGAKEFRDCSKLPLGSSEEKTDFVIQNGLLVGYQGHARKLIIPDGVTRIARRAFSYKTFQSITISASVKEIEQEAFYDVDIKKLVILGKIEKIGANAFCIAYPHHEYQLEVDQILSRNTPIKGFSQKERHKPCWYFIDHFDSGEINAEVAEQNLAYLGSHMLQELGEYTKTMIADKVAKKPELLQKLMEEKRIPYRDMDALIEHFQPTGPTELVAALLNYKAKIGQGRAPKPVKLEMSVAEWRQYFKFRYVDGDVELIGCHIKDDDITVPEKIGKKVVRSLGSKSFDGREICCSSSEEEPQSFRKIMLPDTITQIQKEAFFCLEGMEVYLPNSVTELHEGIFVAVSHLRVHIPNSVQSIEHELFWDSLDNTVTIIASPGSCAETYAKEHNIPFEAEESK